MPKISILVNCFNGARYLKVALDSLYEQSTNDFEIIFIDNASEDNSAKIANSYDTKLKYYKLPHTIPLYAARNHGLQYAQGEFISFLDVDDYWAPNKLVEQLSIMEQHPSIYLVCSGFFRKNEKNKRLYHRIAYKNSRFLTLKAALKDYPIAISSVMLRNDEESQKLIQFDTNLNLTGDYELFINLISRYDAYYIAKPLITLRGHNNNLSKKLIRDWPRELAETHARFEKCLHLTDQNKQLAEKHFIRASALVHLMDQQYKKARQVTKKYVFQDSKLTLLYLASFNKLFANLLLYLRSLK